MSNSNWYHPSPFVTFSLFLSPFHTSFVFCFASRNNVFPASVLNVLLRLLISLLFYAVNKGTQIYRPVNDTEVTTLMPNVPTHLKAAPLCFMSETATHHSGREVIFYISNISLDFHGHLLFYLFIGTKWRRSWTGICRVSLVPA